MSPVEKDLKRWSRQTLKNVFDTQSLEDRLRIMREIGILDENNRLVKPIDSQLTRACDELNHE
jgi:hypothetical protein